MLNYTGYKKYSIHLRYEEHMLSFLLCSCRSESPSPGQISGSICYKFSNGELSAGCKMVCVYVAFFLNFIRKTFFQRQNN